MTDEAIDRLAPLADPVRRALYAHVADQAEAVDRDAAAAAVGIGRPLAAFHLDRLATDHRELTCSLNLAMLSALAGDVPEAGLDASPVPPEGSCCVALSPRE